MISGKKADFVIEWYGINLYKQNCLRINNISKKTSPQSATEIFLASCQLLAPSSYPSSSNLPTLFPSLVLHQ